MLTIDRPGAQAGMALAEEVEILVEPGSESASPGISDDEGESSAFITGLAPTSTDDRVTALDIYLKDVKHLTTAPLESLGIDTAFPELSDEEKDHFSDIPSHEDMVAGIMGRLNISTTISSKHKNILSELECKTEMISEKCDNILKGAGESYMSFFAATALGDCEDLMMEVFALLDVKSLVAASKVCKQWNQIAKSDHMWEKLTKRRWKPHRFEKFRTDECTWRQSYINRHIMERNWKSGPYERTLLWEHSHSIFTLELTSRNVLLVGGFKEVIYALAPSNGRVLGHLSGHRGPVECITSKGDVAVSGSRDETLLIWDISKLHAGAAELGFAEVDISPVRELQAHSRRVSCCDFNGTMVASGSADHTICLWDAETGQQRSVLRNHTDSVTAVKFSPDGNILYSASLDKTVRLYDMRMRKQAGMISHEWAVLCLDVHPSSKQVATGCADHCTYVWNDGILAASYTAHYRPVTCVKYAMDGNILLDGGGDNVFTAWDVSAFSNDQESYGLGGLGSKETKKNKVKELYRREHHKDWLSSIVATDTHIFSASLDHTIQKWGFVDRRNSPLTKEN